MLGVFNLEGIPPAPRGLPQIEVAFDVDANGILSVSAKDKGTGKENKITIQANSGLSDAEIEQMIQDAEANKDEDKKRRGLVEKRNQVETQVLTGRKDLEKYGEHMSEEDRTKVSAAFDELALAAKGEDLEAMDTAMQGIFEKMAPLYAAMSANMPAPEDAPTAETTETPAEPEVKSADFTEVKDKK